jgi:N-methylhydantoinase A
VTDANLLLGRLSSRGLLDGDMGLDPELSKAAFKPLSDKLGFSIEKTAHGVLGIVVANMVRTIRTISVERGHDPRDFVLMPFGGAGPLQARDVAISLGIQEMVVPAAPGIVCAQGLLVSDLKETFVASRRFGLNDAGIEVLTTALSELSARAETWFATEKAPKNRRQMELVIDARYVGQNFELAVPVVSGASLDSAKIPGATKLRSSFCAAHEVAYGYASEDDLIEIVNVRLSASARLHNNKTAVAGSNVDTEPTPREQRPVYFSPDVASDTSIYSRADLLPGQNIVGPAIIEQLDTTTPIYPGDVAAVTPDGHLIVTIDPNAGENL